MSREEYLSLAKQLKENKQQVVFVEDKENDLGEDELAGVELIQMKGLISRMKGRHLPREDDMRSRATQLQYSELWCATEEGQGRSRALSSSGAGGLREVDENIGVRFIDYKKGKQLPYWLKNE